uniref:Uncharacterized protein n=1 Tax=Avena sativa TaxID=4498 RepID=A0ACD5WZE6_AVESA
MGNGITKNPCFSGDPYATAVASDPLPDDSHGHSFMYVPTTTAAFVKAAATSSMSSETSFFSLSGAAISANQATAASMPSFQLLNEMTWPQSSACTFESSRSFAAVPLQSAPNKMAMSGPLQSMSGHFSDTSGTAASISMSGTLDRSFSSSSSFVRPQASVAHLIAERRLARSQGQGHNERSLVQLLARAASKLRFGTPSLGLLSEEPAEPATAESLSDGDSRSPPKNNVQWAQGMAGEDRFHVAVSEEHGWVFVGIYDGFNGPDATDYLFANLYVAVHRELKGVLWDDIQGGEPVGNADHLRSLDGGDDSPEIYHKPPKRGRTEPSEMDNAATSVGRGTTTVHRDVLKALARALRKTEEAFFEAAEQRAEESPELGLMGSCVLVMLMKGTDVYVMNVGDSRVVLARRWEAKNIRGRAGHDLDGLQTMQLTAEHSTDVEKEVVRIRVQHLNDRNAIVNGRVKGKLNVTRAFGVGYLKQPKWNNRLLGAFKIKYIGMDPYINCKPSLCHHRIGRNDKFLVLSSDGLYQYFTNKEVVDQVEKFTVEHPEGDPAQHLVKELLLRAAKKNGMECRDLLEIPHGVRRNYHDDVSIIVISFEGRIWRS